MPTSATMTMQELFILARDRMADMFHETGEVLPMWHAVPADGGKHILIATPWRDDMEK